MLLQSVRPNIVQAIRAFRVDDLMRAADRALASAREKGGNRIVLASIQFTPAGA
jgi:GGDEF domain-containing protein